MRITDHQAFGEPAAARFFLTEDDGSGSGGGGGGTGVAEGGDPDGGSGSGDALADFSAESIEASPAKPQERVEGEKLPDFGALGRKKTPDATPDPAKAPKAGEKPAGGQPAKPAAPSKPAAKPAKPAEKPPAGEKPPEKPAAAAPAKPAEPKAGEKPPEAAKIPTDAEIDALQPKPGAPTKIVEDFKAMRNSMKTLAQTARAAAAEKEALAKEVATLKETSGKLPEDVSKELEGLRKFHLLFNAQNDPVFQTEYEGKIKASEEGVYSLLKTYGLKDDVIKGIQDAAAAAGGNIEAWPHWEKLLNSFTNPIDRQQAINALQARRDAIGAKTAKLDQLSKDREGYMKSLGEKDSAEKKQWAKNMETHALQVSADAEFAMEKDIPEGASDDVKAAIEAHNAEVKKVAEGFKENVLGAYTRDPKKTAEIAFKAVKADVLEKQLEAQETKLTAANERIKALEAQIQKIKSAGRVAHVESPGGSETTPRAKTTVEEGKIGGDGSAAIANFFSKK